MKKLLVAVAIIGLLAYVALAGDINSPGAPAPQSVMARIIAFLFG